jgi:hypothetical protein
VLSSKIIFASISLHFALSNSHLQHSWIQELASVSNTRYGAKDIHVHEKYDHNILLMTPVQPLDRDPVQVQFISSYAIPIISQIHLVIEQHIRGSSGDSILNEADAGFQTFHNSSIN